MRFRFKRLLPAATHLLGGFALVCCPLLMTQPVTAQAEMAWADSPEAESRREAPAVESAQLFPSNALAYLQISDADALVQLGQDERIWDELRQIDDVKEGLASPQFQQFKQVVNLIENRLGSKWPEIVSQVTGGGIHIGFEPLQQSLLVVVKAKDAAKLTALHQELLGLFEAGARNNGTPSQIQAKEFKGASGWTMGGQEFHCIVDDTLLLSNKEAAINLMLERSRGNSAGGSLADSREFKAAQATGKDQTMWGFVRLGPLRIFENFNQAVSGSSDNPVAELIAGGVLDVLGSAPYTIFTAKVQDGDLQLRAELPFNKSSVSDRRAWYFAEGDASARPLLDPPGTILSLSTYRDFSRFWLSRDDLFEDVTLANLSQADTNLGTFFTGMEFGQDVLGSLEPGMRMVIAQQNFAKDQPTPAAKFPAIAFVVEMKEPDAFFPQMLTAFQKTVGVVNIVGGMNGQPSLLLGTDTYNGAQIWKSTYLPEPNIKMDAAPIYYNVSPSCVRVDNHFVIASTTELARQLVDKLSGGEEAASKTDNTRMLVNFETLSEVLAENKAALVAQNMLEEGRSQDQADEQISLLIRLLGRIDPASLRFSAEDDKLTLELNAGLRD